MLVMNEVIAQCCASGLSDLTSAPTSASLGRQRLKGQVFSFLLASSQNDEHDWKSSLPQEGHSLDQRCALAAWLLQTSTENASRKKRTRLTGHYKGKEVCPCSQYLPQQIPTRSTARYHLLDNIKIFSDSISVDDRNYHPSLWLPRPPHPLTLTAPLANRRSGTAGIVT